MKKRFAMILVLALLIGVMGAMPAMAEGTPPLPPHIKDGASVVSIFAAANAYPYPLPEDAPEDAVTVTADAILLYYSDNTFDQYVETAMGYELYSTGTYAFKDGGDFVLSEDEEDVIALEIGQLFSLEERRLADASISEEHALGTIRLDQIFSPEDGREVEAVFADDHAVSYQGGDGVISSLDGIWIYFADGTFSEYAYLDGKVVKFGSGTYQLDDVGDFHILPFEEEYGKITQTWEESLGGFEGESFTFDLGETGLTCLYEKLDDALLSALPENIGSMAEAEIAVKTGVGVDWSPAM